MISLILLLWCLTVTLTLLLPTILIELVIAAAAIVVEHRWRAGTQRRLTEYM